MFHDDGIYVATAKSMAEGKGYRIAGYPGDMPQTKYPPLMPALLSLAWLVNPEFPQNEWLLKSIPAVTLLAWSLACVWYFRTRGNTELGASLWLLVFTLTNHYSLLTSTAIMSEALYGALVIASLAFLADAYESPDRLRPVVIAALFAGAAYHTRTAGICLLMAGVAALLIERRFRHASLFALIGGTCVLAWLVWQNQPPDASTRIERYYTALGYHDLNTMSGALPLDSILAVGLRNLLFILFYPTRSILQLPALSGLGLLISVVPSAMFWFLAGRGIYRAPKPLRPAALFAAITLGILVVYAWMPTRFLLPLLPILLLFAYLGLPRKLPWPALLLAAVLPFMSSILFAHNTWKHGLSDFRSPLWLAAQGGKVEQLSWDRVSAVYAWVRQHTARHDVVLANYDPALFLYTGRQSIRPDAAFGLEIFYGVRRPLPEKVADFESLARRFKPVYLAEIGNDDGVEPDYYRILEALKASGRIRLVKHFAPKYNVYAIVSDEAETVTPSLEKSLRE